MISIPWCITITMYMCAKSDDTTVSVFQCFLNTTSSSSSRSKKMIFYDFLLPLFKFRFHVLGFSAEFNVIFLFLGSHNCLLYRKQKKSSFNVFEFLCRQHHQKIDFFHCFFFFAPPFMSSTHVEIQMCKCQTSELNKIMIYELISFRFWWWSNSLEPFFCYAIHRAQFNGHNPSIIENNQKRIMKNIQRKMVHESTEISLLTIELHNKQ